MLDLFVRYYFVLARVTEVEVNVFKGVWEGYRSDIREVRIDFKMGLYVAL
jgi:hypothetical protein